MEGWGNTNIHECVREIKPGQRAVYKSDGMPLALDLTCITYECEDFLAVSILRPLSLDSVLGDAVDRRFNLAEQIMHYKLTGKVDDEEESVKHPGRLLGDVLGEFVNVRFHDGQVFIRLKQLRPMDFARFMDISFYPVDPYPKDLARDYEIQTQENQRRRAAEAKERRKERNELWKELPDNLRLEWRAGKVLARSKADEAKKKTYAIEKNALPDKCGMEWDTPAGRAWLKRKKYNWKPYKVRHRQNKK